MKIALIMNDHDTVRRQQIGDALPSEVLLRHEAHAFDSSDVLRKSLESDFDLVIHHCGRSNPNFQLGMRLIRQWHEDNRLQLPCFVLFSGAALCVNEARDQCGQEDLVCCCDYEQLLSGLSPFCNKLSKWDRSCEPAPFDELVSSYATEYALEALHALWVLAISGNSQPTGVRAEPEVEVFATARTRSFSEALTEFLLSGKELDVVRDFSHVLNELQRVFKKPVPKSLTECQKNELCSGECIPGDVLQAMKWAVHPDNQDQRVTRLAVLRNALMNLED